MHIKKDIYLSKLKKEIDKKLVIKNALLSFLFGGIVSLIGQIILFSLEKVGLSVQDSTTFMIGIMIMIAAILSAFGIYDKIGQIGKCGLAVPITGFANSMVSSAMEYKPEGFILGIGANTFKLASTVFALGVSFATIIALIRYWVGLL